MISVKGGTQTWSKAEQVSSLDSDRSRTVSATDQSQFLGDQPIGDILNKVADPNWVDPAKMRKVGNDQLDKDAFLKLLLAQLKNQDPTSPMQSHEMAAQLAQFSSLEKLANIDSGIEKLGAGNKPQANFEALNLIGKAVSGDAAKVIRTGENESHEVQFELMGEPVSAVAKIRDANGQIVREQTLTKLKNGKNEFTWNGMDENGRTLGSGEYQVSIEAKDSSGRKVAVQTAFEGIISGVNFGKDGPVLMIGQKTIRMSDVKKIVDPSQLKMSTSVNKAEVKDAAGAPVVKPEADAAERAAMPGNLENVAMSRGMLNQLEKEVSP